MALAGAAPKESTIQGDGKSEKAGAAMTRFLPKNLPWHVQVYDHVYIWAGGDFIHRMPISVYQLLLIGIPVRSEWLTCNERWRTREAFEADCLKYEEEQRSKGWTLRPLNKT